MKNKSILILCQIFHHFDFFISNCLQYYLDWNSRKITMVKNLTGTKKIIKIFSISLFDHTHYAWLNSYQSKKSKWWKIWHVLKKFSLSIFLLKYFKFKSKNWMKSMNLRYQEINKSVNLEGKLFCFIELIFLKIGQALILFSWTFSQY